MDNCVDSATLMEQPHDEELSRRLDGFDATLKELARDLKLLVTLQMKMNEKCPKDNPIPKLDGDMVMSGCDEDPAHVVNKKRKLHDIINGLNYQKHQVTLNEFNNEMEIKKEPHTEEMKNEEGPVAIISSSATQSDSTDRVNFVNNSSYPDQLVSSLSRLRMSSELPAYIYINSMERIRKLRGGTFTMEDVFAHQDNHEDTIMVTHDDENVMRRYESFKKFDTVVDHSDHLLLKYTRVKQRSRDWEENLKKEWKDLEKNLPDGIYVRAYEGRMDLLRAAIVGPQGTPFHDGLFFFDVAFGSKYPIREPRVQYHSGGLRINTNIFPCGDVRLKYCKRYGDKWEDEEMWVPGTSTMLHLLVFVQKILNDKPLFNNAIHLCRGILRNEISSIIYNENTFVRSLKTMVYIMNKPPKNYEDLVVGHFRERACDILKACKAYYREGLQVGSNVSSGADRKLGTNSITFMNDLAPCFKPLAAAFNKIRAGEVADEFLLLIKLNKMC